MNKDVKILDCTLRDGGYYNNWDFAPNLVTAYLESMAALKVDYVEVGMRSIKNQGFKGGFAYCTDHFLNGFNIPSELCDKIGVMVNASELVSQQPGMTRVIEALFSPKNQSPVTLVRIACHVHEFEQALPVANTLKQLGYQVGFNLMQIADRSDSEMQALAKIASDYPIDVLYFADSMGSLSPLRVTHIVNTFQQVWHGELGIHTHDNMNQALANSIEAVNAGVTWVDSTVTGMGRGPGNAQTEYIAITLSPYRKEQSNITKLLAVIRQYFKPLQAQYCWGTNSYYYLAGQYGIHPSYIQEMITDSRYTEEDILSVIGHLKVEGGKKFSLGTLDAARHFYQGQARGVWAPIKIFHNKEVVLLGTGPGVKQHRNAIETYIKLNKPFVLALNTQAAIDQSLINVRVACHPIRLLADSATHAQLPQPLITPASMLPQDVLDSFAGKELFDYGLQVQANTFEVRDTHCVIPTSLVLAYALAVLASGQAKRVLLAGFDGYGSDDPRDNEVDSIFTQFLGSEHCCPVLSVTPTRYKIPVASIYALESL